MHENNNKASIEINLKFTQKYKLLMKYLRKQVIIVKPIINMYIYMKICMQNKIYLCYELQKPVQQISNQFFNVLILNSIYRNKLLLKISLAFILNYFYCINVWWLREKLYEGLSPRNLRKTIGKR